MSRQVVGGLSTLSPGVTLRTLVLQIPTLLDGWDFTDPLCRWQNAARTTQASATGDRVQVVDSIKGLSTSRLTAGGDADPSRPTVHSSGLLDMDGAGDYLMDTATGFGSGITGITIVFSFAWISLTAQYTRWVSLSNPTGQDYLTGICWQNSRGGANNNTYAFDASNNKTNNTICAFAPSATVKTIDLTYTVSGGAYSSAVDGVVANTGNIVGGSNMNLGGLLVGGYYNNGFGGLTSNIRIKRLAIFSSALSADNLAVVRAWAGG